jgi:hypothetical protein
MNLVQRKLILALGLVTSLAVPGLAMADNWNQHSLKHSARERHNHDRYRRGDYVTAERDRHARHERREYRHHHSQRHGYRNYGHYRRHYGHYHGNRFCTLQHRHHYRSAYGVYPGAYLSGVYVSPSLGFVIDVR